MNIVLIGYRGTGKTTVAQRLAAGLGWTCVDSDVEIQQSAGRSIAEVFQQEGEEGFRQRESEVLARLLVHDGRVVSLGGGAVLRAQNRQWIAGGGHVVWLRATPETIFERLSTDPRTALERPNLTPGGGMREIRDVLAAREPLYRECATLEVDTENKDSAAVADEILSRLPQPP